MALQGDGALWEIRDSGDDLNGAYFYNRNPGTSVDYSGQDVAQADFVNLTTSGAASTTLTDGAAGGLFTAAMEGNGIWIVASGNFVAGYYEIITRTDGDNVILDRSPTPGGAGANGAGKVGGGRATITDPFVDNILAGATVWIKDGAYTLPAIISSANMGTAALPIWVIGYNTTRGDEPIDADMPSIDCTANWYFILQAWWYGRNLNFTGGSSYVLRLTGTYARALNCKVRNTSGVANRHAIYANGVNTLIEDCQAISDNGIGIYAGGNCLVRFCETKDNGATGIELLGNADAKENIVHNSPTGIKALGTPVTIEGNTIDGCSAAGIDLQAFTCAELLNNILSNNLVGALASASNRSNNLDYNDFFTNGTDVTNLVKGANALAVDPEYVNRAGDNFDLLSTSPLLDAGKRIRKGVG